MTKKQRLLRYFMRVALLTAENSYATRFKVGSILVNNNRIVASGWNGQPTGFDNCCEKEVKNPDGTVELKTLPTVIHSEANLITFCAKNGILTDGTELYLTLSPCINCALLIIQAGIKAVYYNTLYRDDSGVKFLQEYGITIKKIDV